MVCILRKNNYNVSMQILTKTHENHIPDSSVREYADPARILFFDIETTGLSKESTSLYLIGTGCYNGNNFDTTLFFGDSPSEEKELLVRFFEYCKNFTHVVMFNGTKFDIPYISYKANLYGLTNALDALEPIDIYLLLKPLRNLLFPVSMRQKVIEDFLGIVREDEYNGGELINVYLDYVQSHDHDCFNKLITHNLEDVLGMHKILPILNYRKFIGYMPSFISHAENEYYDFNNNPQCEYLLRCRFDFDIPCSFSSKTDTIVLNCNKDTHTLTFRLLFEDGPLSHFYDNYRDYYYIPDMDTCIHKSAAMGIDRNRRRAATRQTCCIKCEGRFLPESEPLFTPVFKKSYKDKHLYFAYSGTEDSVTLEQYAASLLQSVISFRISKKTLHATRFASSSYD